MVCEVHVLCHVPLLLVQVVTADTYVVCAQYVNMYTGKTYRNQK